MIANTPDMVCLLSTVCFGFAAKYLSLYIWICICVCGFTLMFSKKTNWKSIRLTSSFDLMVCVGNVITWSATLLLGQRYLIYMVQLYTLENPFGQMYRNLHRFTEGLDLNMICFFNVPFTWNNLYVDVLATPKMSVLFCGVLFSNSDLLARAMHAVFAATALPEWGAIGTLWMEGPASMKKPNG